MDSRPLVSIGVPVFNGEQGLTACLDSLLAQDYDNLEIIVSDNASVDGTPAICAEYARRDRRVRYLRAERNRGAVANFNYVFEQASGSYFAWAAHDDVREPSFISACVGQLQAHPEAVLCQGHAHVSIAGGEPLYVAHFNSIEGESGVARRYAESLRHLAPMAIYGVFRSSAVRRTQMFAEVLGSDMAFVQELMIQGQLLQVPRVLFRYQARPNWNTIDQDARVFLQRARKPWWYLPFAALFVDHCSRLAHAPISVPLKMRLFGVLLWWQLQHLARRLLLRVAGALCPAERKDALARVACRRLLYNPNLEVLNQESYFQRVCKPQLGWWN